MPAQNAAQPPEADIALKAPSTGGRLNILIAGQDQAYIGGAADILRETGHTVTTVTSAMGANAALLTEKLIL